MKYKLLRFSLLSILAMFFGVVHADYEKVTSADDMVDGGEYLIVYEAGNVAFNGALETLDAASNTVAVEITDGKITSSTKIDAATFTIDTTNGTVKSASGKYIGISSNSNGLKTSNEAATYTHTFSFDDDGNVVIAAVFEESTMTLRYNKSSGQERFRYYKSGQQAIQLYKKTAGGQTDTRAATTVTLGEYQTTGVVGGTLDLPTATVKAGETALEVIPEWSSSDETVATISDGKINLLAIGTTTIKAEFKGDTSNKPSSASYTLTVTAAPYTSIAAILADITSTKTTATYKFENLLVTYVNGSNTYVSDGTNGFLLYGSNLGLVAGNAYNGTVTGQLYAYNGLPEMAVNADGITATVASEGNLISWSTIAPSDLQNNINVPVTIEDAEFVAAGTGKNLTFKVGEAEFAVYNNWSIDVTALEAGKTYTLTGVGAVYSKNETTTYQLYLVSFEEKAVVATGWVDIKANLTSTDLLPVGAVQWDDVSTGIAVAADGTLSRVAKDADNAIAVFNGKWHGAQYGWANFSATVKVEGCVKITLGQNNYGKEAIVKNSNGDIVAKIDNMVDGKVWSASNPNELISVGYYRTNEPTTLTVEYGSYLGYFAVEAVDPSNLPEEVTEYTVTFNKGDVEGIAPTAIKVEAGKKVIIPANTTLFVEGKTLTAWTDGTNQYKAGDEVTVNADMTLTPVFTQNTVAFADRTAETTLVWQFGESNGAGALNAQGKKTILVTQATIGEAVIDVKMDIDATNGKINNVGRGDEWAQCNDGTILTIPAYKGTAVSFKSYSDGTGTTIGGVDATDKAATYTGTAETLDIVAKGMGYISNVTAVYPVPSGEEPVKVDVNVAFSIEGTECQGQLVAEGGAYKSGDDFTLPAKNFTLYKEGFTQTGWTDGENTYEMGKVVSLPEKDITFVPVFTANEVSLADRTAAVTVKFDFQKNNGAPSVQWQNQADLVWVAQTEVNGKTIDVPTHFSTNPGKFNNTNWGDWCQINEGTTFAVPSCKGATISVEAYNELSKLTIDGQNDYTSAKTISYTVANSAETVDVVFSNEGSYYRYIQVVLPVVASAGGENFNNVDATIEWPMLVDGNVDLESKTINPESAISVAAFDYTPVNATVATGSRSADPDNGMKFVTFMGDNVNLHWNVKPASGITFTPTQIKMYVQRFGTNKKDGVVVSAKVGDGESTTLGTFTARRANWNDAQEEAQWGSALSNLVNEVVIDLTEEQQNALTSNEGFDLYATTGLANNKAGGFADVRIYGKVNGTKASVNMYTLAVAANPAEGGSVSKYPNADEYEENTEVKLTATENFGYDFVNWTDATGAELSTDPVFNYTVKSDAVITANFKKVDTYELKLTVDGTNDYMVKVNPAPEVIDGKWMYEAGTNVALTASQYEGLVTFTNWNDGTTNSELAVTMDADKDIVASYSQADIIAGWDFYKAGSNGRKADFAAQDNDGDALNLVNTETGETSGWLDKSTLGGGGYESFAGAAVNWRTGSSNGDVGNWHWQTKINAEAFTDINVQFQMLYNYNAYQTYDAEYSLDGDNWTKFGSITMTGTKAVASFNETLPAAANNQKDLYIRMKADKTSNVDGAASPNDGNTLAMFFITGTPKLVDDGKAPVLVSTVPADKATGASASGKIVLTFDERVKVADGAVAYINDTKINSEMQNPTTPTVSGKTITFQYKGLAYATQYVFTLAGNTVADLTDNFITDPISLTFTTMARPTVEKKAYDQVVENAEQLLAAIDAAQKRSDKNTRYRIFIKNGNYTIPLYSTMKNVNGYDVPECITFINTQNVSFIGESRDGVIITNGIDKNATFAGTYGTTSKYDGIGNSDVFQISGSDYYFQDLTIESGMDDATGRDLAVQDKATRTIYKNTGLRGYQDTWTSNNDNGLYYFEGGYVRGRTDYMCGKGDAFFNGVELRQLAGGYAAVPSKSIKYGYVYKDCIINGEDSGVDGNYTLGRPWGQGTPVALFIDTKMNVVPSAIGWNEMSGGWPKRFAEYNSMTSTGSQIDLSGRKTVFADSHANDPVLTAEEAAEAGDLHNMFGEWDPTLLTEQAPVPTNVKAVGPVLTWDDSNYALLWAVCKDGKVIAFTTEATYTATENGTYSVRAANEMGGLSEASAAVAVDVTVATLTPAKQYTTYVTTTALDFSNVSGMKAYIATSANATSVFFNEVGAVPAETPLLLITEATATVAEGYAVPVAASAEAPNGNLLKAGDGATTIGGSSNFDYVLKDGMFHRATEGTVDKGKAYLHLESAPSNASELTIVIGETTGINSLTPSPSPKGEGSVYNLNGQRVAQPTKGLYIVNGKKIVIK